MSGHIDMTGRRVGWLVVVARGPTKKSGTAYMAMWLCHCACGKEKLISGVQLRNKRVQSCGCKRSYVGAATGIKFRQQRREAREAAKKAAL